MCSDPQAEWQSWGTDSDVDDQVAYQSTYAGQIDRQSVLIDKQAGPQSIDTDSPVDYLDYQSVGIDEQVGAKEQD